MIPSINLLDVRTTVEQNVELLVLKPVFKPVDIAVETDAEEPVLELVIHHVIMMDVLPLVQSAVSTHAPVLTNSNLI